MRSIDDQIRKAIEEGQFDNLSGKGKPLHLDENVHEDPEWRLANHVLKNAGYSLPWIEERRQILIELDTTRKTLSQVWTWCTDALEKKRSKKEVDTEWQRAEAGFREKMTELDKRIRDFNLAVPSDQFNLPRLKIDKEINKICSGCIEDTGSK